MKEIKYTTDGKKVVVIGSLNSTEKIVQEIFVCDGSEIPSGEHFVVKSLHDAPAVSWKEKTLKETEARYDSEKKKYDDELNRLRKSYDRKRTELQAKLGSMSEIFENVDESSFQLLIDYICGNITHVVQNNYGDIKIIPFEEFIQLSEGRLRLISIFGNDKGTLKYMIGQYSDYSGQREEFIPFNNYQDAFEKFKELILNAPISKGIIKIAREHGINLDPVKIETWKANSKKGLLENIANYEKQIRDWENHISELN